MLRLWWTLSDGRETELVWATDSEVAACARALARDAGRPWSWRLAAPEDWWNAGPAPHAGPTLRERAALRFDARTPPTPDRAQFWMLIAGSGARVPWFGTAEEALTRVMQGLDERRYLRIEPATPEEARTAQAMLRAAFGERCVHALTLAAAAVEWPRAANSRLN